MFKENGVDVQRINNLVLKQKLPNSRHVPLKKAVPLSLVFLHFAQYFVDYFQIDRNHHDRVNFEGK